jgi:hypothetical protein
MKKALLAVALVLPTVFFTIWAEAAQIRVSQESSPGAGDFDVHGLGVIESFVECEHNAVQSYAHNVDSYGGTTITPQTDTGGVL